MNHLRRMKWIAIAVSIAILFGAAEAAPIAVEAETLTAKKTTVNMSVSKELYRSNWEFSSSVSQFVNAQGEYCFAYDKGKKVVIVRTKNGVPQKDTVSLKKKYSLFGGVICDSDGNYYMVTGRSNSTTDDEVKTIFVSKYDSDGNLIKTVGDNGDYDTCVPFSSGGCDMAINGNILAVNYARRRYDGHQSNAGMAINIDTMETVGVGISYGSHSFAQRIIAFGDGFLSASEGDCFPRAFTVAFSNPSTHQSNSGNIFHFWVEADAYKNSKWSTINNNFAHMGGLTAVNDELAALVGTSAKSLNSKAENQNEQLFIQIFDPTLNLSSVSAYTTTGTRIGLSGENGDEGVMDCGVKWLTSYNKNTKINNPQVVSDGDGTIVILFEKYVKYSYKGLYYMVLNQDGDVVKKATKLSATAQLCSSRMPVYSNGRIYWTGNKDGDSTNALYVYSLAID